MNIAAWIWPAIALAAGYLLGSVPFGVLLTRAAGAGDLRTIGSGNIGATNVLRTGRKGLAAATLILDALKGAVAVWLAMWLGASVGQSEALMLAAGAGAFAGHLFPVWLGFRGGKGVATYLGIALALHWPCGLIFAGVWIAALLVTRISSVGGIAASLTAPVSAALTAMFPLAILFLVMTLLVIWKHRANLGRLLDGTEPRVGRSGRASTLG